MGKLLDLEKQVIEIEEQEYISDVRAKARSKKTLTGKYYVYLLRKEPIKYLLIIGAILGCIISVYLTAGVRISWWWIPLSTFFIGPLGLVFFALILPFIPWIVYIILRVVFEIIVNS